ncbi:MAG TPA: sigma factor [Nitrospira sp.]|nr:sigma factor [Nitrospira sp.]
MSRMESFKPIEMKCDKAQSMTELQLLRDGPDETEDALLIRLRQGDVDAFAELVPRYHAQLVRRALRYIADLELAKDVVQDTWVAVTTGLAALKADRRFGPGSVEFLSTRLGIVVPVRNVTEHCPGSDIGMSPRVVGTIGHQRNYLQANRPSMPCIKRLSACQRL